MLGGAVGGFATLFLRGANLDLFESQELLNYATVVHRCIADAADEIQLKVGAERPKVSRATKGFLGLS
jgi:hypothetical protein